MTLQESYPRVYEGLKKLSELRREQNLCKIRIRIPKRYVEVLPFSEKFLKTLTDEEFEQFYLKEHGVVEAFSKAYSKKSEELFGFEDPSGWFASEIFRSYFEGWS